MFKVGDRVRYINNTETGVASAIGQIGTVVSVTGDNYVKVQFDLPCWQHKRKETQWIGGLWKWELVNPLTKEEQVLAKVKLLDKRYKERQLKKGASYVPSW